MFELFHKTSESCSKIFTHNYSTSFSLGIRMFHPRFRQPICNIYGFVRLADEIVDTMHQFPKRVLLEEFREQTFKAIDRGVSTNPILQSFQETAKAYDIDRLLIKAFLDSMEMDLEKTTFTEPEYKEYIYGSAEVIGLMCLKVFCERDDKKFEELSGAARKLGSAFQKVNFIRDIKSDYIERGRVYFPDLHFERISLEDKLKIEKDIESEFKQAAEGINNLPSGCKLGVYIAFLYYSRLFKKIKRHRIADIKEKRIRISNLRKIYLLALGILNQKLSLN